MVEKKLENFQYLEREVPAKENEIKDYLNKIQELEERVSIVEKVLKKDLVPDKPKLRCPDCDFETNSSQGLKVHVKRKHTLTGTETLENVIFVRV